MAKFGTRRPSNKLSCLADVVAVEFGGEVVDDDDVAVVVFDEAGRAKILYIISLLLLRKLSSFYVFQPRKSNLRK